MHLKSEISIETEASVSTTQLVCSVALLCSAKTGRLSLDRVDVWFLSPRAQVLHVFLFLLCLSIQATQIGAPKHEHIGRQACSALADVMASSGIEFPVLGCCSRSLGPQM